jgi:hypothetical protein
MIVVLLVTIDFDLAAAISSSFGDRRSWRHLLPFAFSSRCARVHLLPVQVRQVYLVVVVAVVCPADDRARLDVAATAAAYTVEELAKRVLLVGLGSPV